MNKKYWPFEVLPTEERTAQHKSEIRFLERANREGYEVYADGSDYGADAADGRAALLIFRGRGGCWEVVLSVQNEKNASAIFDDFTCASEAVLQWLRGEDAAGILSEAGEHLIPPRTASPSDRK
jgi:hypothetical protein